MSGEPARPGPGVLPGAAKGANHRPARDGASSGRYDTRDMPETPSSPTGETLPLHALGPPGETGATLPDRAAPGGGEAVEATPLPTAIAHYKVVRSLGEGGMGRVLKCLDTTLGRYVALKILAPRLSRDQNFIARFQREARAVAKLRHPNIVQVYSIAEEAGLHYFTMEYVEGEGLDRLLERRGKLPEGEAIRTACDVAKALAAAHAQGILHRDVKPGNVLLDSTGRVMLSDFGLAKVSFEQSFKVSAGALEQGAATSGLGQTDPGRIMGTPFYMAPEVILGRDPTPAADVYAVGVMLYEMLTGAVPFRGSTVTEVFKAHVETLPAPIADTVPGVTLETARVVYRTLEKDPGSRYADAAALAKDLEALLDRERLSRERAERARLGAEMAAALAAMRPAARRGLSWGRAAGLGILLAFCLGGAVAVMRAIENATPARASLGSSATDRSFLPGEGARACGMVLGEPEEGATDVRFELLGLLDGQSIQRALRVSLEEWARFGGEAPKADEWWAAEGTVAGSGGAPAETARWLAVRPRGLWKPNPVRPMKVVAAPGAPGGEQGDPLQDFVPDLIGRRVYVEGMIAGRADDPATGEVRLLVSDGKLSVEVKLREPVARSVGWDMRIGEPVRAQGTLEEIEGGSGSPVSPLWAVRVAAQGDCVRLKLG